MSDSLEKNMIGSIHLGDLEIDIFKYCNSDRPFMIKMIQNLKPEYFESMLNAKIFRCYKECFEKFNKTPTEKILNLMLQNMGEQQNMIDMIISKIYSATIQVDNAEREYITKEVVTFAKRARMIDAIGQSLDLIDKNDFEKIVQITKEALLFNLDIQSGYDLYDVDTRYRNLLESTMNVIPTGYSQIDSVLYGGWRKKELYCVMGPPGFGKSIFLPNFGIKALLNGLNVVHYSLEMSEDRIGMRYDAIASSISVSKLIDSPEEIKEKYETYKKITKSRLKLKEFPTSMASIMDIEAHLDNLKLLDDFDPDLIIIDYGDIMKSTRSTKNTYEEQGWIFRELRGLAIKRNIAIITATQTRRDALTADGGTSDMVGMDQAADSMEKNRILDVLFSITQSRADRDQGRINLWVAKNRNGASNQSLEFTINYKNFQIKEINLLGKNQSSINPNDISKKLENELSMELENEENT